MVNMNGFTMESVDPDCSVSGEDIQVVDDDVTDPQLPNSDVGTPSSEPLPEIDLDCQLSCASETVLVKATAVVAV